MSYTDLFNKTLNCLIRIYGQSQEVSLRKQLLKNLQRNKRYSNIEYKAKLIRYAIEKAKQRMLEKTRPNVTTLSNRFGCGVMMALSLSIED